ncbi:MAG: isoprenyl transferase [Atopobiaceae bacterium]|nr:isoprenyl transferase [Atopobiaceae bacterium]MCI2173181.1 isoprenyl transferase [Atopobiaceae bacterium]MCI2208274.1 isoprenyl transferase [Atopobiaceae bacterium]
MQRDEEKLGRYFVNPPDDISLASVDLDHLPRHISLIMDGNGRWATSRGLDRSEGHVAGVKALRETITASVRLGIDVLTAYAFSTENWRRPQHEVDLLMHLFATTLVRELPLFERENVRLVFLGDLEALPRQTKEVFEEGLNETAAHTGMTLGLAVNYGSRAEMVRAARTLAAKVSDGTMSIDDIDADAFSDELYTTGLPDPELLIRTSGEMRLSNYLLWQLAYTEFYVTDTYWPDFGRWDLLRAISSFQSRDRRFGGVK